MSAVARSGCAVAWWTMPLVLDCDSARAPYLLELHGIYWHASHRPIHTVYFTEQNHVLLLVNIALLFYMLCSNYTSRS